MAVTYFAIPGSDDQDSFLDQVTGFMADFVDKLLDGQIPRINVELKSFIPGVAETALNAIDVYQQDDTIVVNSVTLGRQVVVNVVAGVAATTAVAAAILAVGAPTVVGAAAVIFGAAAVAAVDQIVTPVIDYIIGDTVENFFELLTGTLDDQFYLTNSAGTELAGAVYTSGLGATKPLDAARDLLEQAASNGEIGVPTSKGQKVVWKSDGGTVLKTYNVSDFNPFAAQADALSGSGLSSAAPGNPESWGWAQDSNGHAVANNDIGTQLAGGAGLFLSEDSANFAFMAWNGQNLTQLSLELDQVGHSNTAPVARGGTQLLLGGATAAYSGGNAASKLYFLGGSGFEHINGSSGADALWGGGGNDNLYGHSENDTLGGGTGNDELYGGGGNDSLLGGYDNDTLDGGADNDTLNGEEGSDTLYGGGGEDELRGGYGEYADRLEGGADFDTYWVGNSDTVSDSDGSGVVMFNGAELKGAKKPADDDDPHNCRDEDDKPNNSGDEEDKYIGEHGEEYERAGGGLTVTLGSATITIEGWSQGDLGIKLEDEEKDPTEWSPPDCFASPLVFDLDGDGIEITRLSNSSAYFDIDADGDAERTAWVAADDGILAIDLNGNGMIDGAQELFGYGETYSGANGNSNALPGFEDGGRLVGTGGLDERFTSGFDALAVYDLNLDGVINTTDTYFGSLRMWRDLDGDGRSDEGELFALADVGVSEIALTAVKGDREVEDSLITDTGSYVNATGDTREVSDVWFRFNQFDTVYDKSAVTDDIRALPNIVGTGGLPDLHVAMAEDGTLRQMVEDVLAMDGTDLSGLRAATEGVLMRWARIEDVDVLGRGASANGQRIALIEVVSDTEFAQWSGPDPRTQAGQVLDLQYEMILRDTMVKLAAAGGVGADIIPEIAFNNAAFIDLDAGTASAGMLDSVFDSAPADWAAKFAHIQAGVMMLDRVYLSFSDVKAAGDDGATYKADVEARLAAAGIDNIDYATIIAANIGTDGDDAMISPSLFGIQFFIPTEVALTGAGDDELKWGNKEEVLLWGAGQGHDEIDADIFFARASSQPHNSVRMQELLRSDVTIGRNDGPIGNDVVITITATGETLTFRNLLMADNSGTVALEFADGEVVDFADLEGLFSALVETGTDGDDTLFQRQGSVLDGGAGDDVLMGGVEATTYVFGRGYGHDEIVDDRGFGAPNTLEFGPGITPGDLSFERPENGDRYALIITIADTGETVTIVNQFANTRFKIDTFRFDGGFEFTAEDILFEMMNDDPTDQRLVGSGRGESFGFSSQGNDTFVGLGGDDIYQFGAGSGQDVVEDRGYGRYNPDLTVGFYRGFFVDEDRGDIVEIGYAFADLTVSRAATRLTFLHEPSGDELVVDNTRGFVERYTFAGDDYVYTLPEVMDLIDGNIEPETGSEDDDHLIGDDNGNDISGGLGNDTIEGMGGPDTLSGDEGDDLLDAGDRSGTPSAYRDDNTLLGGAGDDTLLGGFENDLLDGGDGADRLEGDYGRDTYIGGAGDDLIFSKGDGGSVVWNLGDGNDLVLGTTDGLTAAFGTGIAPGDLSFSIEKVDIAGLTDYYEFDYQEAWAMRVAMPDGSVLTFAGTTYSDNFTGLDDMFFADTGETISMASIIADLYAPSDDDQIFVGTRSSDVFAPGGGYDQIFFDYTYGTDTVSIGLGDGENVINGQVDRLVFESEVLVGETTFERTGARFEDLRITLVDGTVVNVEDIIQTRQEYDGVTLRQTEWLGEMRFGDGTVMTLADLLSENATPTAGDDITTGDIFANDFAQSAGNDTLRGSGGGDSYHFGAGAGQDVIIETAQGYGLEPDNYEFTFYDLSQLRELDTLYFGAGITAGDLTLTQTGGTLSDLRIDITATGDSLLISDQFNAAGNWGYNARTGETITLETWHQMDEMYNEFSGGPGGPVRTWGDDPLFSAGIERFVFADGSEMSRSEFQALVGASDNSGDNVISTGITGGVLDGGAGNDDLRGGTGDDFYRFDAGYDSDHAMDAGGVDTLEFGAGLSRGQLTLTRRGDDLNDLLIEVGGTTRTALYVEGQFAGDGREIEVFTFADGATLTAEEIRHSLLTRSISNGDDNIVGFETSDLINARKGDDVIEMRGGNDIVDGGEGFDVVVLRGPRADYVVEIEGDRIVVTDLSGRDGVNRLYNVERLVFADDPLDAAAETQIELVANIAPEAGAATFTVDEDGVLAISQADLLAAASDPDGASVALVSVTAASGGTLEAQADGSWLFTPEADFNGQVTFDYVVEDAGGLQATGTATIDVAPQNDAPVAGTPIPTVELDEDTPLSFVIPADAFGDIDGDPLSLSLAQADGTALPTWLSFDGSTLSGTPPQDWSGYVDLRLTANDGTASTQQGLTLHVMAVNDAPEAVGTVQPGEVVEGDVLFITLSETALFSDVDGDPITLGVTLADGSALPAWLSFDPVNGVLSGVAPAGSAGTLDLVVSGSDGFAAANVAFEVTVTSANSAPELAQPLADVASDEDSAINIALPAGFITDPQGDTLTYAAVLAGGASLPGWLAFDPATLTFAGQPPADWHGTLDLEVSATDGEYTVSDTFTLSIDAVNDAPVAADDTGFTATGSDPVMIDGATLLANDADIDGDALAITGVSSAVGGMVTLDPSGVITFVADTGFEGEASFAYSVSDGALSDSASVSINVTDSDPYAGWQVGTEGNDWLFGCWWGGNQIYGAGGNDRIFGHAWADSLHGGEGNDRLFGFAGNDELAGQGGNDRIFGHNGMDTISGGTGNDQLWGGNGDDTFVFREGDGIDRIKDFETDYVSGWHGGHGHGHWHGHGHGHGGWVNAWFGRGGFNAENDVVVLDVDGVSGFDDLVALAQNRAGGVVFSFGGGDKLSLTGTWLHELDADNFVFV